MNVQYLLHKGVMEMRKVLLYCCLLLVALLPVAAWGEATVTDV